MERQTKLAHLKLVSKYYGYTEYACPRQEEPPTPSPYRRDDQASYFARHEAPSYRPMSPRTEYPTREDRSSIGSDSSTPGLIDDRTDSEASVEDDYQYHASTSQLWDSFWLAEKKPSRPRGQQYPALIPSPHIRRANEVDMPAYQDWPMPPTPVEYSTSTCTPLAVKISPRKITTSWPLAEPEKSQRKTIRPVASYSLFPRPGTPVPAVPAVPAVVPLPRTSSLTRPGTPSVHSFVQQTKEKKQRPPPIHLSHSHQEPAARPLTSSTRRPHTSHSTKPPAFSSFPCTSLDLITNPRSAPLPPTRRAPEPPKVSVFDFDSDSEAEPEPVPERGSGLARLVKTLQKPSAPAAAETRRAGKGGDVPAGQQPRRSRAGTVGSETQVKRVEGRGFGRMFRTRATT